MESVALFENQKWMSSFSKYARRANDDQYVHTYTALRVAARSCASENTRSVLPAQRGSAAARSVCVNGPLEARARVRTSLVSDIIQASAYLAETYAGCIAAAAAATASPIALSLDTSHGTGHQRLSVT